MIVLAIQSLLAGRSDDAERLGVTAVDRAEASGSADTVAFARATLGRIALANNHWELGELAAESLVHDDTASDLGGHAELIEVRGRLALRRGEQTSAVGYLQAAQAVYRRRGRVWRVVDVSLELGKLGRSTRNWTLARTSFETAATLGDSRQRAHAALGLAELAFDQGERTSVLAGQLADATQMLVAAGDATLADIARERRGVVLMSLDRDAEARKELELARSGFENRGQAESVARVQDVLAQLERRGEIT